MNVTTNTLQTRTVAGNRTAFTTIITKNDDPGSKLRRGVPVHHPQSRPKAIITRSREIIKTIVFGAMTRPRSMTSNGNCGTTRRNCKWPCHPRWPIKKDHLVIRDGIRIIPWKWRALEDNDRCLREDAALAQTVMPGSNLSFTKQRWRHDSGERFIPAKSMPWTFPKKSCTPPLAHWQKRRRTDPLTNLHPSLYQKRRNPPIPTN